MSKTPTATVEIQGEELVLIIPCPNGHTQKAKAARWGHNGDGTVWGGWGSAADFCDECESPLDYTLEGE